jgi:hypothetical protein
VRDSSLPFFLIFPNHRACLCSPATRPLAVQAAMDAGAASLTTRLGFPSPQLRVGPNPVPIRGP